MRHKYETVGIVIARAPLGEANALVTILTPTLGLVRARAQGVRKSGAKLSAALTTFAESDLVLVRGKEGWRVAGAVLVENWFERLPHNSSRTRAARVTGLFLRLVAGETNDERLFSAMHGFFESLTELSEADQEVAELLVVIRILSVLGLDAGEIPGDTSSFGPDVLEIVKEQRREYVSRINHGIEVSGL